MVKINSRDFFNVVVVSFVYVFVVDPSTSKICQNKVSAEIVRTLSLCGDGHGGWWCGESLLCLNQLLVRLKCGYGLVFGNI